MPIALSEQPRFWRLPWQFDALAMQADLDQLMPQEWQVHFNTGYHDGGWSGLALVSGDGDAKSLYAAPGEAAPGRATPLLSRCPALAAALARLPFVVESARLLRLNPGAHIREHRDHGIGLEAGSIRLHLPIRTAPGVEFYVDGARLPMAVGECWYVDFGLPHRVQNRATTERVHLVVDCRVDDAFIAMLPTREISEQQWRALSRELPMNSQQRFEQFRAAVLCRPEMHDSLLAIDDADAMVVKLTQLGAERGLDFTAEDVRTAAQAGRRGWLMRHAFTNLAPQDIGSNAQALSSPGPALLGWVPVTTQPRGDGLSVELCRLGQQRFTEPFFEDSVNIAMQRPFHTLFRQRVDAHDLADWLKTQPGLPPAGFIFHMSRCGSTLLSQVLATSAAHRVLSEPGSVDQALCAGPRAFDDPERGLWLQAVLGMLGHTTDPTVRHLFIKFDSWHASQVELIRRYFPQVPWVFLIRDPVEVIVSHLRRTGAQMVPGMLQFAPPGIDMRSAATMPREEYVARMLGSICQAVLAEVERDPSLALVLDYAELGQAIASSALPHLGVPAGEIDPAPFAEAMRRDAKNPHFDFAPDSASKQREASAAVHAAAERWVIPAYRGLRRWAGTRIGRAAVPDQSKSAAAQVSKHEITATLNK